MSFRNRWRIEGTLTTLRTASHRRWGPADAREEQNRRGMPDAHRECGIAKAGRGLHGGDLPSGR